MPFIGNKPSAVPLTSADITDGIITSAKIADGTIVNADINASAAIAGTKISGSFGKVLQVITATDSTQRTTTSTSFVTASNTLSISITPSSASNKIFVISTGCFGTPTGSYGGFMTIYRDSTNLGDATEGMGRFFDAIYSNVTPFALSILDSPSSTSALTYQVYIKAQASSPSNVELNRNGAKSSITAFEISG